MEFIYNYIFIPRQRVISLHGFLEFIIFETFLGNRDNLFKVMILIRLAIVYDVCFGSNSIFFNGSLHWLYRHFPQCRFVSTKTFNNDWSEWMERPFSDNYHESEILEFKTFSFTSCSFLEIMVMYLSNIGCLLWQLID